MLSQTCQNDKIYRALQYVHRITTTTTAVK